MDKTIVSPARKTRVSQEIAPEIKTVDEKQMPVLEPAQAVLTREGELEAKPETLKRIRVPQSALRLREQLLNQLREVFDSFAKSFGAVLGERKAFAGLRRLTEKLGLQ